MKPSQSTPQGSYVAQIAPHTNIMFLRTGFSAPMLCALVGAFGLLLAAVTAQAVTLTYDFNDGTLQGWHNRVWDPALNAGAGAWFDLAPNATDPYPLILQPPSAYNNVFGNYGSQVDPVGGQTDNHLNTLWLRSPQFTLDASGNLTVQMARGKAHGSQPANDNSVSYVADGSTGWKGVALRRVSDGAFVLAKPRTSEGDAMVTVTFTAAELAPYVGVNCTLDLINSENGGWGWLSMDNVSIPGTLVPPAKLAAVSPSLVIGNSLAVVASIPNNYNASAAVTVYVTNSNPGVIKINGSVAPVTTLIFPAGTVPTQTMTVTGTGLGYAQLTTGCAGLISDEMFLTVLKPSGLIGRWFSGSEDLLDKSGYTPAGTHDGVMSGGLAPVYSVDVPPGAIGSSLDLAASGGAVLINNSVLTDPGYRATFDDGTARQLSVVLWAKGLPDTWNPFVSKYGEGSVGWQVRKRGDQPVATFTVRGTSGEDDPYNGSTLIDDGAWHHYAATWDGVTGIRKLYVDGKLNNAVPHDAGPMGLAKANYLTLGGRCEAGSANPGNTLVGQLYDVQIYGVPLSSSDVQNLFTGNLSAVLAYADNPVIDLGKSGSVSVSIPANANAASAVTMFITNTTPSVVSLAGAVGNVLTLTFPAGGVTSQPLTLTGLAEGQAQLVCVAAGLTTAYPTVKVYGPHLVGQWFNGTESYANGSAFNPPGTHDGIEVGTVGNLTFTTDTPPSKAGKAAQFGGDVALLINNSSLFDAGYEPTFDDVIAQQFSVSFWAKGTPATWNGFISKRGDDAIGWQVRRGYGLTEAFTVRGTGSGNEDGVGSVAINDGVWHHFAAVWDGHSGTRKCYVDGTLDPSVNLTNDFSPMMMAPNHHLVLGAREQSLISGAPGIEGAFYGLLYDVRIYNYPLSAAEVQTLSFIPALRLTVHQRSLQAPLTMAVDVVLPAGANQSQAVTVKVTNNTPAIASLVGAVGNVVTLNYPVGGSLTQQVTVAGISDGLARLTATGGGFLEGTATFNVWADPGTRLIGHWLSGAADLLDTSGFRPAGTHDGVAVGPNAGAQAFSGDVPPGYSGVSLDLGAGNVAVIITNSSAAELGYVETFDNQMANKFSITFWAKGTPSTADWNPWISKRGEDNQGYQVRRFGGDNPIRPTFTLRGTAGDDDPWIGTTVDNDTWHHYAATWDGATGIRKLYLDGHAILSMTGDFGPMGMATADHLMLGGRDQGGFGNFFPGLLFDVRVYSYALNAQEVGVLVNPPVAFSLTVAHRNIPIGETVQLVITLPTGTTATAPVTVYLTNNSPGVVAISGPSAITFPIGSLVQVVNLQAIGVGQIDITAGLPGLGSAVLSTINMVVQPKLIGHWLSGTADLADKSGYSLGGTHDGVVVGANPGSLAFSPDVPAGFSGLSLNLTANGNAGTTVGVVVTNSASSDAGYQTTFDDGISSVFSATLWAKGVPSGWDGFISKRGEDGIGWQVRRSGGDTEAFTVRGTASGNFDGVGSVIITPGWHHYAAVWDGIMGIRKCYVDGVLDPSINLTEDFAPMSLAPNYHLGIGAREASTPGNFESWFNGKLYDVRIFNYAITPAEVASLFGHVTLTVQAGDNHTVILTWPTTLGFVLQTNNVVGSGWGDATGLTVTDRDGVSSVTNNATGSATFYRLIHH